MFKRYSFWLLIVLCLILFGTFQHYDTARGAATTGYATIQNNGTAVPQENSINFVNGGCVDNAGLSRTDCTIAPGSFGGTYSSNADGWSILGGTIGRTLTVTGSNGTLTMGGNTLTLANNLTTAGNFGLTLTQTGITNVTLPVTGTLSTLAGTESFTNHIYNGLTLTSAADGFTIAGGTTPRTLTFTGSSGTLTLGGFTETLAGNFTTAGAFGLTLTQTGITNVTLPTTGTLATLAGAETFSNKVSYNGLTLTAAADGFTIAGGTTSRTLTFTGSNGTLTLGGFTETLAGNFTTSGAFGLTLTQTGTTNVTLPTTGTLATLAGVETWTNKTLTTPTFSSNQFTLAQAGGNYTVSWANPAAARTLTIADPLGSDTFAYLAATQTFTNKTLTTPTFTASSFTLAQAGGNYTVSWANPGAARTLTIADPGASDTFGYLAATQAFTNKTYNGLTLTSAADGFTAAGGTTSRTLTVTGSNGTLTLGGNTLNLAGNLTTAGANPITLTSTGTTNVTLPTGGTIPSKAQNYFTFCGYLATGATGKAFAAYIPTAAIKVTSVSVIVQTVGVGTGNDTFQVTDGTTPITCTIACNTAANTASSCAFTPQNYAAAASIVLSISAQNCSTSMPSLIMGCVEYQMQ